LIPEAQMKESNTLLGVYTVRQAGRGLVLTVPQKWADEHGVVAGSLVSIDTDGNRLVVEIVEAASA